MCFSNSRHRAERCLSWCCGPVLSLVLAPNPALGTAAPCSARAPPAQTTAQHQLYQSRGLWQRISSSLFPLWGCGGFLVWGCLSVRAGCLPRQAVLQDGAEHDWADAGAARAVMLWGRLCVGLGSSQDTALLRELVGIAAIPNHIWLCRQASFPRYRAPSGTRAQSVRVGSREEVWWEDAVVSSQGNGGLLLAAFPRAVHAHYSFLSARELFVPLTSETIFHRFLYIY